LSDLCPGEYLSGLLCPHLSQAPTSAQKTPAFPCSSAKRNNYFDVWKVWYVHEVNTLWLKPTTRVNPEQCVYEKTWEKVKTVSFLNKSFLHIIDFVKCQHKCALIQI